MSRFPAAPRAMRSKLCDFNGLLIALIFCLAGISSADAAELSSVEGIKRYEKLILMHPQNATYHNALGYYHLKAAHFQQAEASLLKAILLDESYATAHNNLGVVYLNQERPEQAERQFRRAVELKPNYSKAQYNLAVALFRQKRYAKAAEAYMKAKGMDNHYVEQRDNTEKIKQAIEQVVDENRSSEKVGRMK